MDDLRTDACPSPPRDKDEAKQWRETITNDNKTEDKQSDWEYEQDDDYVKPEEVTPPKISSNTSGKYKNFRKPGTKTKCDNIIYINKSNGIHIGSSTTYNLNVGSTKLKSECNAHEDESKPEPVFHETAKIKELMTSNENVETDHLILLSGHITASSWKLMARKLGYSEGQIEHFHADHKEYGMKEVIYQCLLHWTESKPEQATLGRLINVLWSCKEREAVDIFSHYFYEEAEKQK